MLAEQIFMHLKKPERTTNTHFFEPAWRSMGVEVVNWSRVDKEVVDWLLWFFAQSGKAPIATQDAFSFILNRLFETWGSETAWMLQRATSKEIDRISEEFLGAGPFGIMTNPLTYSSLMRRATQNPAYTPSKLLLSVDKWTYNKPGTKVDVDRSSRATTCSAWAGWRACNDTSPSRPRITAPGWRISGTTTAVGKCVPAATSCATSLPTLTG